MKKIIIVDGGPRRNMNTASMLDSFERGVAEADNSIEVKRIRLYELDYKGCMSCLACKVKGHASNVCVFKDGLHDLLTDLSVADGFVLGSPIYMGRITGQSQAFLERVVFPWLSYNDFSLSTTKKMPTTFIYTMNATEEYLPELEPQLGHIENLVSFGLGPVERIIACNTTQVRDYSRYEMAAASQGKAEYREQHWEQDLQKAYEAGKRMAQTIAEPGA